VQGLTVSCLSAGRVRPKRGERGIRRYLTDDWSDSTLPVNVFLIEHPQGLCLVDVGQTAAAARKGYFPRWYPFFALARFELSPEQEIAAQLRAGGIDPTDVRWVVLTHLHTDHVGGLAAFAHAEVVVVRAEWERARGLRGRLRGYLPQYWPPGITPRLVDFNGPSAGPFAASYDVAGDGTLLLVPLPGHTPTHAGLLVRSEGSSFLCVGDAAHTAVQLAEAAPWLREYCLRDNVTMLAAHDDRAPTLAEVRR
jgi:N-acyl homoserine lactone hydrolase